MKAMILAAGRGKRMRPLTNAIPKALLEVKGKSLIVRTMENLSRAGIREIVINHAHLGKKIETALGDGSRYGVAIRYSPEAEALETAGGIAHALALLGDAPFVAVNADILCDYDFSNLSGRALEAHLAHLVLVTNPPHHPLGDFNLAGSEVRDSGEPKFTFSGIGLYRAELFTGVAPGSRAALAPLLRAAMAERQVTGELHRGEWHDVGTPERLAALNASRA